MDFLILIFLLLFVIALGCVVAADLQIFDITKKYNVFFDKISKITLGLFIVFVTAISFFPFESLLNSLETMAFLYMFGILIKISWNMLMNKENLSLWIKIWAIICGVTGVIELIKYRAGSLISNIVEFGVIFVACVLILTIVTLIKKNEYGSLAVKSLFISYGIIGVLMGLIPPIDLAVSVAIWIIMLVPGVIIGGIILFIYKKRYAPLDEMTKMVE